MRDDGRGAGSRPPAHAGGNEHHVRAAEHLLDALAIFFRRSLSHRRLGPGAQTLGDACPDLQLAARLAAFERLRIGVDDDELDSLHTLFDHVIDCITAAAAHTDHLDYRILSLYFHDFKHRRLLFKIAKSNLTPP